MKIGDEVVVRRGVAYHAETVFPQPRDLRGTVADITGNWCITVKIDEKHYVFVKPDRAAPK